MSTTAKTEPTQIGFFVFLELSSRPTLSINYSILYFQGSVLNGGGYIAAIIIFSILFNINKLFEYETVYVEILDQNTNTS